MRPVRIAGHQLATLAEVRALILALPQDMQEAPAWQAVGQAPLEAAENVSPAVHWFWIRPYIVKYDR